MILLIEDRVERQYRTLNHIGFSLNEYSDIIENAVNDKYKNVYQTLKEDNFDFSKYSFIICHKSAFNDDNISIM